MPVKFKSLSHIEKDSTCIGQEEEPVVIEKVNREYLVNYRLVNIHHQF